MNINVQTDASVHTLTPYRTRSHHPDDIICVMLARNESLRIRKNLEHHRKLGVTRFVILDNNSDDGTLDVLLSNDDVDIWQTGDSLAQSWSGVLWIKALVARYGLDRWYLVIDADELLVYPNMETVGLRALAKNLESRSLHSFRAPMIDMYSRQPMDTLDYKAGNCLIETCPYFDGDSYEIIVRKKNGARVLRGGPRARLLSRNGEKYSHALEKYPFRFWRADATGSSMHANPYPSEIQEHQGALLHFKFLNDFQRKIGEAIAGGQYQEGAKEYKAYQQNYDALNLPYYAGSRLYTGPDDLVKSGIICKPDW